VTVGYTDLRAPGKAHEEYYRLVQERGVRYVRSRVGEILEEQDGSLTVRFEDTMTGRKQQERFDMVVLSPPQAAPGRHAAHRHVPVRHGPGPQEHPRIDRPGQGRRGARDQHAQHRLRDDARPGGGQRRRGVHRLRRLRGVLPQTAIALTLGADAHSVVDPNICRGCGICAADCPTGAIQLGGFSDDEVLAEATV